MGAATGSAESFWREHVEAWRASGQSRSDYCAARGLARKTFGWWAWRFDRERRPAPTLPEAGHFLPVEIAEMPSAAVIPNSGVAVRVGAGFDLCCVV